MALIRQGALNPGILRYFRLWLLASRLTTKLRGQYNSLDFLSESVVGIIALSALLCEYVSHAVGDACVYGAPS